MLVGWRVVVIFAVFLCQLGAAFVENAGQEDETSKALTAYCAEGAGLNRLVEWDCS